MKYSFTCPLSGCGMMLTIEAPSDDEAADQLANLAKEHLTTTHPNVHKTDIEVKNDIQLHMMKIDMSILQ